MFKRILVPLDGSTRAERAIPVAARIARAKSGSVVLMQVATIPVTYASYLGSSTNTLETIESELTDAESYLRTVAGSEVLRGIEAETQALYGVAAATILSTVSSYKADLVVMTSHGYTGTERWLLGSVAQEVARHSPVPVLVLHEKGAVPAGPHPDGSPLRALVTLDGSALAEAALEPAAQLIAALATPAQGAFHLLRVVRPPTFDTKGDSPENIDSMMEQALHKARTYLNTITGHLRESTLADLNLTITWSVMFDTDPAAAIIRVAEHGEGTEGAGVPGRCDLIALATHGRSGWEHWVRGSVTERVLGATKLPLLIVRPVGTDFKRVSNGAESLNAIEVMIPQDYKSRDF
jgi:nucleotide-binding universal stress UspA family protein